MSHVYNPRAIKCRCIINCVWFVAEGLGGTKWEAVLQTINEQLDEIENSSFQIS